jgi:hypothetical protein
VIGHLYQLLLLGTPAAPQPEEPASPQPVAGGGMRVRRTVRRAAAVGWVPTEDQLEAAAANRAAAARRDRTARQLRQLRALRIC